MLLCEKPFEGVKSAVRNLLIAEQQKTNDRIARGSLGC